MYTKMYLLVRVRSVTDARGWYHCKLLAFLLRVCRININRRFLWRAYCCRIRCCYCTEDGTLRIYLHEVYKVSLGIRAAGVQLTVTNWFALVGGVNPDRNQPELAKLICCHALFL